MKKITIILLLLLLPVTVSAKQCIDWPKTMTIFEISNMDRGKVVVIEPFEDKTKWPGDEWLTFGLRDFLTDLLRTGSGVRVLSGLSAQFDKAAKTPAITIRGAFNHKEKKLEIYFNLYRGNSKKLVQQFTYEITYPEHTDFFNSMKKAAKGILDYLTLKYNEEKLSQIAALTDSTACYTNYAKGRNELHHYNPKNLEVASTWFKEAVNADVHSPLGYQGLTNLLTFQALYNKQAGETYSIFYQQAQAEYLLMIQRNRKKIPIENSAGVLKTMEEMGLSKLPNRFLAGNLAYMQGSIAEKKKDWKNAANGFERATKLVPEDALSWFHLSNMLKKLKNNKGAKNALNNAKEINPCID
ncbi:MAG: hypothetical protein ABIE74_11875 [Pseudomonadota bacterium]